MSLQSCGPIIVNDKIPNNTTIIRYGTPFYYDSQLTYYYYNGWYYYPYYRNNIRYFHRFERPLPPKSGRPMYRHPTGRRPKIIKYRRK